jgi:poly(beta-D-mannuronate) lyase
MFAVARNGLAAALLLIAAPAMAQVTVLAQAGKGKEPGLPASPKSCDAPPPAVRDIVAESIYTDAKHSVVNAVIVDRNNRSTAALDRALKDMIGWSSLYLAKKDQAAATCALSWMSAWAKDGAMLGAVKGETSESERKWRTAGIAIAYMKIKDRAEPGQIGVIEPWLKALADKVISGDEGNQISNNRRYWSGLAATAVGFATGSAPHQAAGRKAFDQGLNDVAQDGHLPAEMNRGQIAAHLHNYAIAPLVLAAEIAARNGQNWYGDAASPLHRLAAYVAAVNADPAIIQKVNGAKQKQPSTGILGWQAFYTKRFPGKIKPAKGTPPTFEYSWLGGDLTGMANAWVK